MGRELRAKLEEVGPGKVAWMSRQVHFSSVRQAEQRNNEEEHGAKRGVRGLYKLGQRVLTESPHRTSPRSTACRFFGVEVRVRVILRAVGNFADV